MADGETSAELSLPFFAPTPRWIRSQKATTALETALREKGFGLHRVALLLEVGETVTLNIVKFSVVQSP